MTPGNAGESEGALVQGQRTKRRESREIGDEPTNSTKGSETAEYIGTRPSKKKVLRLCREISELTQRRWSFKDEQKQVAAINRKLHGWSNYFFLGAVSNAYGGVDRHVNRRLRRWLCIKHQVQGAGTSRFSDEYLYQKLGVVRLSEKTRNFPWAKA